MKKNAALHTTVLIFLTSLFFTQKTVCQNYGTVYGKIKDSQGTAIKDATIAILGSSKGALSKRNGSFTLKIPSDSLVKIGFSFVGYETQIIDFTVQNGEKKQLNIALETNNNLPVFEIKKDKYREEMMTKVNPNLTFQLPSAQNSIEALIKTLPGVASNNELSSQYSVRGGNFDENLVYVNGIEIYRPFLIRSGQQEGLSFINSDLVDNILFSAGGFNAQYGDKMSSVLDVTYKEPLENHSSVSLSFLGASAHLEGSNKNHRFKHISGIRYQTNRYLLGALDTKGEYTPSFVDFQSYLTFDLSEKSKLSFLTNIASNTYQFVPQTRETNYGTFNEALRLTVFFEGQEIDQFNTQFGALSWNYSPKPETKLRHTISAYRSNESEKYDIEGAYLLGELERDPGKEEFGDVKFNRGVGSFLNHARNYLEAQVVNFSHNGTHSKNNHTDKWGFRVQYENIKDQINEWGLVDSSGFSLPKNNDSVGYTNPNVQPLQLLELNRILSTKNQLVSMRYTGFIQRSYNWKIDSMSIKWTAGIRVQQWDFNNETLFSPRTSISVTPNWKKDVLFRAATGYYYQPPFYKELRRLDGTINTGIKAQKSTHFTLGMDYNFKAWSRPFKLTSEVYYKLMSNIIPYDIDNVRIRYYGENNAKAYARGIDLKVNGEFIKNLSSWFSLSFLQTQEDLNNDFYWTKINSDGDTIYPGYTFNNIAVDSIYNTPGYIARPTDQRVTFSTFFQDHLPRFPQFRMNLGLHYGTGLPFGPPNSNERYKAIARMPAYRRVDIGFSYVFKSSEQESKHAWLNRLNTGWVSLEVFNLFGINNTVSYLWVKDTSGRQYAVPNFLTSRQINLKLHIKI